MTYPVLHTLLEEKDVTLTERAVNGKDPQVLYCRQEQR